jgi:hypothetical protein
MPTVNLVNFVNFVTAVDGPECPVHWSTNGPDSPQDPRAWRNGKMVSVLRRLLPNAIK